MHIHCVSESTTANINLKARRATPKRGHPQWVLSKSTFTTARLHIWKYTCVFVCIYGCLWQNVPLTKLRDPVFLHVTYTRGEWTCKFAFDKEQHKIRSAVDTLTAIVFRTFKHRGAISDSEYSVKGGVNVTLFSRTGSWVNIIVGPATTFIWDCRFGVCYISYSSKSGGERSDAVFKLSQISAARSARLNSLFFIRKQRYCQTCK